MASKLAILKGVMEEYNVDPSRSIVIRGLPEGIRNAEIENELSPTYGHLRAFHVAEFNDQIHIVEFISWKPLATIDKTILVYEEEYLVDRVPDPTYMEDDKIERAVAKAMEKQTAIITAHLAKNLTDQLAVLMEKMGRPTTPPTGSTLPPPDSSGSAAPTSTPPTGSTPQAPEVTTSSEPLPHAAAGNSGAGGSKQATPTDTHLSTPSSSSAVDGTSSAGLISQPAMVNWERPSSSYYRLKTFSGVWPVRNGEASFEEWSRLVGIVLEDKAISSTGKRQRILSTLQPPAFDVAFNLGTNKPIEDVISHLKRLYHFKDNGPMSLQEFYKQTPKPTERPSDYLIRLEVELQKVLAQGGITEEHMDKTRFHQFRSTNRNHSLYSLMNAAFRSDSPAPSLVELMDAVKEMERTDALYAPKNPQSHVQNTTSTLEQTNYDKLQAEIASLKSMLSKTKQEAPPAPSRETRPGDRRRDIMRFCYNCGDYSHQLYACQNPSNSELVQQRLKAREDHRRKRGPRQGSLNYRGPLKE